MSNELERHAELVSTGIVCPTCHTDRRFRGCQCSRERLYSTDAKVIAEWFDGLPEEMKHNPRKGMRFQSLAERSLRRLQAICDVPEEVRQVDNLLMAHITQPNPRWHKPQTMRTRRADREPI